MSTWTVGCYYTYYFGAGELIASKKLHLRAIAKRSLLLCTLLMGSLVACAESPETSTCANFSAITSPPLVFSFEIRGNKNNE